MRISYFSLYGLFITVRKYKTFLYTFIAKSVFLLSANLSLGIKEAVLVKNIISGDIKVFFTFKFTRNLFVFVNARDENSLLVEEFNVCRIYIFYIFLIHFIVQDCLGVPWYFTTRF